MYKLALALILAAVVAAPALAGGAWTTTATVLEIHGTIDASGVYLTDLVLDDGSAVFTARCNGDARELPQVCDGLVPGQTYIFDGRIASGTVPLQVERYAPSQETVPANTHD